MNFLFEQAPLFVPGMKIEDYQAHDLEMRAKAIQQGKKGKEQAVQSE
jgi:hypothetical protein